jgi:hypothetical protein
MSYVVEQRTVATSPSRTQAPQLGQVRSYLAVAVVCALLCFAPLGVAAVVYAGNVRTRLALGDLAGARRASRIAKRLCWASAATTMAFLLVIVVGAGSYSSVH